MRPCHSWCVYVYTRWHMHRDRYAYVCRGACSHQCTKHTRAHAHSLSTHALSTCAHTRARVCARSCMYACTYTHKCCQVHTHAHTQSIEIAQDRLKHARICTCMHTHCAIHRLCHSPFAQQNAHQCRNVSSLLGSYSGIQARAHTHNMIHARRNIRSLACGAR